MDRLTWALRVTATGPGAVRVATRTQQFNVGRPIEFDPEAPAVSALEYLLGAAGAEVVSGLRAFAKRRRVILDGVEAVVAGELEGALTYLEVDGESKQPRVGRIDIKVYVSSPAAPDAIQRLFDDVVARLPIAATLRGALDVNVALTLIN